MRLGALEAGGTKMVCAIGDENGNIFAILFIVLNPMLCLVLLYSSSGFPNPTIKYIFIAPFPFFVL